MQLASYDGKRHIHPTRVAYLSIRCFDKEHMRLCVEQSRTDVRRGICPVSVVAIVHVVNRPETMKGVPAGALIAAAVEVERSDNEHWTAALFPKDAHERYAPVLKLPVCRRVKPFGPGNSAMPVTSSHNARSRMTSQYTLE